MKTLNKRVRLCLAAAPALIALVLTGCHQEGIDVKACERARTDFKRYYEEQPARIAAVVREQFGDEAGEILAADLSDLEARQMQLKMIRAMLGELDLKLECAEYILEKGIPTSAEPARPEPEPEPEIEIGSEPAPAAAQETTE